MLFLELQNKEKLELIPNALNASINEVDSNLSRTTRSLYTMQQAQGVLGKDVAATRDLAVQKANETKYSTEQSFKQQLNEATTALQESVVRCSLQQEHIAATCAQDVRALDIDLREHISDESRRLSTATLQVSQRFDARSLDLEEQLGRLLLLGYQGSNRQEQLGQALSGNLKLVLDSLAEDVSAAALNAAATGTFQKEFVCTLSYMNSEDEYQGTHEWASFEPVITAAEDVDDESISAPTVTWKDDAEEDPRFNLGLVRLVVTFDTDAGVTKTYAEDDAVSVDVQVSAEDKWMTYAVVKATKTYNVIA